MSQQDTLATESARLTDAGGAATGTSGSGERDHRAKGAPLLWIGGDVRAKARWLYGSDGGKQVLKALVTDGTLAMVLYRSMQQASRLRLSPIAMLLNKLNIVLGGCVIGRHADFGRAFVLIHSSGVVINSSVQGGAHVYVEHQVTIGAERDTAPLLGDHVFVGAGAKVIGAVRIGDHVKVGANAVVVKDAPDGATVVGIPAQIVRENGVGPGAGEESAN